MEIHFRERTALVTGATRGIGCQIANDLERAGAKLLLTGTDPEEIERLNSRASVGNQGRRYFCVDFTSPSDTSRFLEDLASYGRIDVCINNAGTNRIDFVEETKTEDWDDLMAVNLKAPYLLIRHFGRRMKAQGYGRILNIGSVFAQVSRARRSIYSTTKFGLLGLTKAVSNELARFNVLVNMVSPGFVLTDLTKSILSAAELSELEAQIPIGRLATPADISKVVLFLASDQNTYVSGQNILVDGGFVNV